jgi:di/tricarboxylate transporter
MTTQIVITLAIIVGALVLFITEKLRVDVVALIVLLSVTLTGLIGPEQMFAGFSSPAVITVWAVWLIVLSGVLRCRFFWCRRKSII